VTVRLTLLVQIPDKSADGDTTTILKTIYSSSAK